MCRMIIALGNVNSASIFAGIQYMANDEGKITSQMIPQLHDQELQKLFLKKGPQHGDGWGMAYLENDQFSIKKSLQPVFVDSLEEIKTNLLLLHARFISIGDKKIEDTHPYEKEGFVFCHNGTIRSEIKYNKEKFRPEGNTDSERLFFSILSKDLPLHKAIKQSFDDIPLKPNSNIILANKETTYVYSSSRTLSNYFRMKLGKGENSIVVSSEQVPHLNLEWEDVPFDKVIKINNKTLAVTQL